MRDMKLRLILLGCVFACVLPLAAEGDKPESPLALQMSEMDDAYKAMKKETDPEKGAAAARIAQQAVAKGLVELPEMLIKMPDGPAKSAAAAEYRKLMGETYVAFCKIEQAFLSGKIDEVPALIEAVKALRKSGHQKFIED